MIAPRQKALWFAAVSPLVLVGWTAWRDSATSTAPDVAGHRPLPLASVAAVAAAVIASRTEAAPRSVFDRDPLVEADGDPFAAVSFVPPAPKAVAVVAPPAPPPARPAAPAFPYRYFGRMVGVDGQQLTYLSRGDTLVPAHAGAVLDTVYRIDAIGDKQIKLTYLPLDEKLTLDARSAQN
jgi:hypothetical protein